MVSAPLLRLSNVTKHFDSPAGAAPLIVLQEISLEVDRGESVAVVGPSGSGKSTLLHIIGTLDRPSSGTVTLGGQDLGALNETEMAAVRNRQVGFVFQAHYLLPQCTVWENVLVPTLAKFPAAIVAPSSRSPAQPVSEAAEETPMSVPAAGASKLESVQDRAHRLLRRVGLSDRRSHRPGQLSGGERQRVAVVRALINQPKLLLADEPTGSLDHSSAQELGQLLLGLNQEEGVTLIIVTHDRELAQRMGRLLELKEGRLIERPGGSTRNAG